MRLRRLNRDAFAHFTPYATYSHGVTRPLTNTDINGRNGTWASSNPAVMLVGPAGKAFALTTGTARISFVFRLAGPVSSWDMKVTAVESPNY
jgi:hypothetical protein